MSDVMGSLPTNASYYTTGLQTATKVNEKIDAILTKNPISKAIDHVKSAESNVKTAEHSIAAIFHLK